MTTQDMRQLTKVLNLQSTSDGDGVKIGRVAGFNRSEFSPFLMLDELKSDQSKDYVGGFPPHPHRGIETLTYMRQGHFQHQDHLGHIGQLRSGGAQWMAAGRGIIHSEMPMMEQGQLHGFQLWINQAAKDKMQPAQYHDFQPESITEHTFSPQSLLRVISGEVKANDETLTGPLMKTGVPAQIADWQAKGSETLDYQVQTEYNLLIFVYEGQAEIQGQTIKQGQLALLPASQSSRDRDQAVQKITNTIHIKAVNQVSLLLLSGQPIDEPVVHYGPFVMNSIDEINQTIDDYNQGKFETYQ
ncbi:MAG: pirin family protein [Vibrio sp.]